MGRCEMIAMEVAQGDLVLFRARTLKTGAPEHDLYPVDVEVTGDAPPEKLDRRIRPVGRMHAATAQFQETLHPPRPA